MGEMRCRRSLTRSSEVPEIGCVAVQHSSGQSPPVRSPLSSGHLQTVSCWGDAEAVQFCSTVANATHVGGCDSWHERSCLSHSFTPTRTFSTFEAFFAANLHSDLRGMVLGRRREKWVMTQLLLHTSSIQWGRAGSNVVVEGAPSQEAFPFSSPRRVH